MPVLAWHTPPQVAAVLENIDKVEARQAGQPAPVVFAGDTNMWVPLCHQHMPYMQVVCQWPYVSQASSITS